MVDEAVSHLFDWGQGQPGALPEAWRFDCRVEALLRGEPRIAPDLKHAHLEDRLIAVGRTALGRPLFVAFTIRERFGRPTIRPVSVRHMHAREARNYEAQGSQNDH
jgi:hypothetical protein